jgi:hypothetical protein
MTTKKNTLKTALIASALALLSTASQATTILLQSQSSHITVGDEILVDVILQDPFSGDFAGDQLLAFGFDLSYDNAAFTLTSKTVGPLWDDDTPFFDLDLAGSTFPGIEDDGMTTSILLGQLSFSALSVGSFSFGVSGSQADSPNHGLIYLGGESNLFAQSLFDVHPVPAPAAGWLLATGLVALARLRRRR